jgi:hypothetical protein
MTIKLTITGMETGGLAGSLWTVRKDESTPDEWPRPIQRFESARRLHTPL